ncbi:MAG: hypothetical protein Q9201_002662 [Fulgogasparrea decipioides]
MALRYLVYSPTKRKFHAQAVDGRVYLFGTYYEQVQRLQLPLSEQHGLPPALAGVGTLSFDTQQELLWIGSNSGRITSYYGADVQKYTSLQAHPPQEGSVAQFLFNERGVISLASRSVTTQYEYMMMKFCRYICAGTNSGAVHFMDPETLKLAKSWQAHSAKLSDMDARNNYLVTCGWSVRPYGPPTLESFAKVYDLRKLEMLPPIPFHGGAAWVQMHPKLSTTSILSSTHGQLQVVDLMNPNTSNLHQANLGNYMSHLVLAPSGAAWALADLDGVVQIWAASRSKLQYTESPTPTEFADEIYPLPLMSIDSDLNSANGPWQRPFSTVGMPYYREKLLSAWSEDPVFEIGFLPPKIDPDIFKHLSPAGVGFRAPNPRKTLRNQMERLSIVDSDGIALAAPKFLSEKNRDANGEMDKERRISDAEAFTNPGLAGSTKADVPVMYRLMEIKYSRYGVDDFDFG